MTRVLALLCTILIALLCSLSPVDAGTTCADGGITPGAQCHTSTACTSSNGVSFSGTCIGVSTTTSFAAGSPGYIRCSSAQPICAGGPVATQVGGCKGDGDCPSGSICVSDSGLQGCGTGFATCMVSCSDSTTTTTTSTSTTSTSA